MTIMTAPAKPMPSAARSSRLATNGRDIAEALRLGAIGLGAAVGGALFASSVTALLIAGATGSLDPVPSLLSLSLPFLGVTLPVTAIWFLGAVGTRLTARRLGPALDAVDRAAFAELIRLLERSPR